MITTILSILGIVWIISDSRILKSTREWLTKKNINIGHLLNCWGCVSFWVAMICVAVWILAVYLDMYILIDVIKCLQLVFSIVFIAAMSQVVYDKVKKI